MYNEQGQKIDNTDPNIQRGEVSEQTLYEHELNEETRNIIFNCEEIMSNIELDLHIQSIDNLYQEGIYIEMFKKMFPMLKETIQYVEESNASTGEKFQQLINGLSTDVLTMDLTHIRGQAIADKDPRHLINFLQIILELSKLYSMKKESEQNNEENYEEEQQYEDNYKNPAIMNYEGEDQEEGIYQEDNGQENEDPNLQDSNHNMEEASYKNQNVPPKLTKKKSQQNLIQEEKKKIESNIYSQQNQRVITNAPNIKKMVPNQYQPQEEEQEDAYVESGLTDEQRQDTQKIQELFNLYKIGAIPDDDPKLQELHFLLAKHGLTLEEILKHEEAGVQVYDQNPDDNTISQVINKSRSKLQKMRNPINYNVDQTEQQIRQGQSKYQTYLRNYKRDYEKKMKKKHSNPYLQEKNEQKRKRLSEHEDKVLKKEYHDVQLSLHYQMKDKKVQYLRNIHKIIFELEKKKIIDEQNEYKENKQKLEEEAKNKLISIENKYKDRMQMLKEALDQQRRARHIAEVAQRQELSKQERELKQIKRKQIEDLKDLWRCEREKFDLITKDDRKLESEILELYKKY